MVSNDTRNCVSGPPPKPLTRGDHQVHLETEPGRLRAPLSAIPVVPAEKPGSRGGDEMDEGLPRTLVGRIYTEQPARATGWIIGAAETNAIPGSLDEPAGHIAHAVLDGTSHVRRRATLRASRGLLLACQGTSQIGAQ